MPRGHSHHEHVCSAGGTWEGNSGPGRENLLPLTGAGIAAYDMRRRFCPECAAPSTGGHAHERDDAEPDGNDGGPLKRLAKLPAGSFWAAGLPTAAGAVGPILICLLRWRTSPWTSRLGPSREHGAWGAQCQKCQKPLTCVFPRPSGTFGTLAPRSRARKIGAYATNCVSTTDSFPCHLGRRALEVPIVPPCRARTSVSRAPDRPASSGRAMSPTPLSRDDVCPARLLQSTRPQTTVTWFLCSPVRRDTFMITC